MDNEFAIEKNVRQVIQNLENLTANFVNSDISGSSVIDSLLDQLSLMRVILVDVLSVQEFAHSKSRLE